MRLRSLSALVCCLAAMMITGCGEETPSAQTPQRSMSSVAQVKDLMPGVTDADKLSFGDFPGGRLY